MENEHYFLTHDVAGKTVTRSLRVPLERYGGGRDEFLEVKEITVPVFDESGEFVVRFLQRDLPISKELDDKREAGSLLFVGGGTADAKSMVKVLSSMEKTVMETYGELPFRAMNIIGVPHISSAPRTKERSRQPKQSSFADHAKVLLKAISSSEIKLGEKLSIVGASAGGAQAIELASLLGDKCAYLVLIDPAGMADNPRMLYGFVVEEALALFAKAKEKERNIVGVVRKMMRDIKISMVQPEGVPGLLDILMVPIRKNHQWVKLIGRAYGLAEEQASIQLDVRSMKTDSTVEARKKVSAKVLFSPIVYAKVVNVITSRLKDAYPSVEKLMETDEIEIKRDVEEMLRVMFPKSEEVIYAGYRDSRHSIYFDVDDNLKYWKSLIKKFG